MAGQRAPRIVSTALIVGLTFSFNPVFGSFPAFSAPAAAALPDVFAPARTSPLSAPPAPSTPPESPDDDASGTNPNGNSTVQDQGQNETPVVTEERAAPPTDEPSPNENSTENSTDAPGSAESGLTDTAPARITPNTGRDTYSALDARGQRFADGRYFEVQANSRPHYFVSVNGALSHFSSSQFRVFRTALERSATQDKSGVESLNPAEFRQLAQASGGSVTKPSADTLVVANGAVTYIAGTSLADYQQTPTQEPTPRRTPDDTPSPSEPTPRDDPSSPDDETDTPNPSPTQQPRPDDSQSRDRNADSDAQGDGSDSAGSDDHEGRTLDPFTGSNSVPNQAGEDWAPGTRSNSGGGVPTSNDYSDPVPGAPGSDLDSDAIAGPAPNDSASEESSDRSDDSAGVQSQQSMDSRDTGFPWALAGLVTVGVAGAALALLVLTRRRKEDS